MQFGDYWSTEIGPVFACDVCDVVRVCCIQL